MPVSEPFVSQFPASSNTSFHSPLSESASSGRLPRLCEPQVTVAIFDHLSTNLTTNYGFSRGPPTNRFLKNSRQLSDVASSKSPQRVSRDTHSKCQGGVVVLATDFRVRELG